MIDDNDPWAKLLPKKIEPVPTVPDLRDNKGRFLNGSKPGPGRPKGSRSRLTEKVMEALKKDFTKHGVGVIEQVRAENPGEYLKIVLSLLPRSIILETESLEPDYAAMSHSEIETLHNQGHKNKMIRDVIDYYRDSG